MVRSVLYSSCNKRGARAADTGRLVYNAPATRRTSRGRRCTQRRGHQRAGRVLLVRPQVEHERGVVAVPCNSPERCDWSANGLQSPCQASKYGRD